MRTRTSARNQDRLYRYLAGPAPTPPRRPKPPPLTDAEIDLLDHLSKPARAAMKREARAERARIARRKGRP